MPSMKKALELIDGSKLLGTDLLASVLGFDGA